MWRHLSTTFTAVLADDVRRVNRKTAVRVDDDTEQTRIRLETRSKTPGFIPYISRGRWEQAYKHSNLFFAHKIFTVL